MPINLANMLVIPDGAKRNSGISNFIALKISFILIEEIPASAGMTCSYAWTKN